MTKHVSITLPDELITVLQQGNSVAILATFSEKGIPNTTPIQWIYPKGKEGLLLSIHKDHTGYHNMAWQKKVMISFLEDNNITYSVLGRAGVLRAPSEVHPLINVVRVDVIDVKSDKSVIAKIDSGVRLSYTSFEAEELSRAVMNELKELSVTL
jgi:hypothetical protein